MELFFEALVEFGKLGRLGLSNLEKPDLTGDPPTQIKIYLRFFTFDTWQEARE